MIAKRSNSGDKLTLFQKIALFFYDRPRFTLLLWLALFVFGILSYATFLKREGFPSVEFPFSVASGNYLVNDASQVDNKLAKPISDIALKQPNVDSVLSQSQDNHFSVFVQYKSGTDPEAATERLKDEVEKAKVIPAEAEVEFEKPRFGITERGDDVVISFFARDSQKSITEVNAAAQEAVKFLKSKNLPLVQDVSTIDTFATGTDPTSGQEVIRQTGFDRYGERKSGENTFYNSVVIGIFSKPGADIFELDKEVQAAVNELNSREQFKDYEATVSATFADDIRFQLEELQTSLLVGLLAVLIVGSIVIAVRASLVTVISMLTVLTVTLGALFIIGYSLNTITLFALVLGLALIVDDTIIMVESIDTQRFRQKTARAAVLVASRKIGRAMTAATITAVLSFAPLIFVGGILGDFIRAIPVTIIISLLTSFVVALMFIPLFAHFLLLTKSQIGGKGGREIAKGLETAIARFIARPMLWAKNSGKRLLVTGLAAVFIGIAFVATSLFIFQKVTFNIFPATKDTNQIMIALSFPPETNIESAQAAADRADDILARELGGNFDKASYYGSGTVGMANLFVDLTPYNKRDARSPQIIKQLEDAFQSFEGAQVKISQIDVGPPAADFTVRIYTGDDEEGAYRLAADIAKFMQGRQLERISGEKATVVSTTVSNPSAVTRADGKKFVQVSAEFDGTDTSTLVTLAENAIKKEFPPERVAKYGLDRNALDFNIGQEEENQESFKSLALAFPILLVIMYLLLSFQFKSLLQPALIFLAIPFSLLGITLGLYLTDNAFSFFTMLGFFALIGLSLKNTILLTDYANQARAAGAGAVDSTVEALEERFRPLIATSLTAVVSLIPLALLSPFWEGLVVVLICGLLSSTFLVVTVFPYYYLGGEYLRRHISRKTFGLWLVLTIALVAALVAAGLAVAAPLALLVTAIGIPLVKRFRARRA